jgi:hypothetical protein
VLSKIAVGLACVAVAGGLFALGRATAPGDGDTAGDEGFAEGVRAGRAAGVREGRALQAGVNARHPRARVERAFRDGYDAGANDVFGGFDGGWSLSTPYVITLRKGSGTIAYRIDSRRPAP